MREEHSLQWYTAIKHVVTELRASKRGAFITCFGQPVSGAKWGREEEKREIRVYRESNNTVLTIPMMANAALEE